MNLQAVALLEKECQDVRGETVGSLRNRGEDRHQFLWQEPLSPQQNKKMQSSRGLEGSILKDPKEINQPHRGVIHHEPMREQCHQLHLSQGQFVDLT